MYNANEIFTGILNRISKEYKKDLYELSLMIVKGKEDSTCRFYMIHDSDGYLTSKDNTKVFGLKQLLGVMNYTMAISFSLEQRIADVIDKLALGYNIESKNLQALVRKEWLEIKENKGEDVDGVLAVFDASNNDEPLDMVSQGDITSIILSRK